MSIIIYAFLAVLVISSILFCLSKYNLPELKFHNTESDYQEVVFEPRNLLKEISKKNEE